MNQNISEAIRCAKYSEHYDVMYLAQAVGELLEALAQPEQEPVAYQQRTRPNWKDATCWTPWEDCSKAEAQDCWDRPQVHDWLYEARALYTTPPQRRPLTDEEIIDKTRWFCVGMRWPSTVLDIARAIEASHGIKG